ncbi:HAD family phosphatase [Actinomadura keratinilytica]|uniref:HAD-IA family hydrolase n=1 Tax=Actinomadura keratinilytica TaxID=547461 RepID=A0ABP7YK69_9ACTN
MPAPGPVTSVIFDIGGVIIDWDPLHLYRKLIPDDAERERFLTEVCSDSWNAEQDRGRSFAEAVEVAAARHPDQRELIEAYWRRWPEMLGGPIPGVPELVAEIHGAGTPMFAITNWSAETYPIAVREYPVLELFRDVVVSGEVKVCKPDPEIFRLALQRFGVAPHETLFVDDNPVNVAAAEALGMGALLFTDATSLRDRLKPLGLL